MKNIIYFLLFFCFSCKEKFEKRTEQIKVRTLSIEQNFGTELKKYNILKESFIKNDCKMFVYHQQKISNSEDTLKIFKNGTVQYNNTILKRIDEKKIKYLTSIINLKKYFYDSAQPLGADVSEQAILYVDDSEGLIVNYFLGSTILIEYSPERYSAIQYGIINNALNFKRNEMELEGKP